MFNISNLSCNVYNKDVDSKTV